MEISIENKGSVTIARLYGRLDSKGAGSIYDTIVGLGSLGPDKVIVNMRKVDEATRAGTSALIIAAKMLHTRTGEKLLIHDASPEVASVIEGSGYHRLIEMRRSSEAGSHIVAQFCSLCRNAKAVVGGRAAPTVAKSSSWAP